MNELTFLDLVILKKTDAESTVEKFGTLINTSFFETANLLGTTKIKGYINIESSIGGISKVTITDAGTGILAIADQKSKEPIEPLDNAILHALAGGARELEQLQTALNIRPGDLAYHLNKLVQQGFMDYEVRSAKVYFVLTEMGFNSTGGVRVQQKLETEKQAAAPEGQAGAQKELPSSAPPWVRPADVKPEPQLHHKPDVDHILKDEKPAQHGAHKEHEHAHKHEGQRQKKELTPEEMKKREQMHRTLSKLEYYVVEYAPYLILILVVAAIFAGAVFLSLSKL